MVEKPSLLIIADDDLSYGIEKGYYPDLSKAINLNNLAVYPLSNVPSLKQKDICLSEKPIGDGEDVYLRNPYADCYVSMKDADILNTFVETKIPKEKPKCSCVSVGFSVDIFGNLGSRV